MLQGSNFQIRACPYTSDTAHSGIRLFSEKAKFRWHVGRRDCHMYYNVYESSCKPSFVKVFSIRHHMPARDGSAAHEEIREQSRRRRMVLKPEQAVEIYALKPVFDGLARGSSSETESKAKGRSVPIGKKFNVSAKTIRAIWNRRTWRFVTRPLWKREGQHCRYGVHLQVNQPRLRSRNRDMPACLLYAACALTKT